MSLRTQIESLLLPKSMERFADQIVRIKIIRYLTGHSQGTEQIIELGPFPTWFTLYDIKLHLWNTMISQGDPDANIYAPPLVYLGQRIDGDAGADSYKSVEMVWKSLTESESTSFNLLNPVARMTGPPDERFVDSAGGQKALGKDNRTRMTLDDVFELSEGKKIPELCAFIYNDLIDRIPGQRPLGERDIYGRIVPYFPFLDVANLPSAAASGSVITVALRTQAQRVSQSLDQIRLLEAQLKGIMLPKLDGVKLLRWLWYNKPEAWEGAAVLFFGLSVTHNRPFMRFFPASGQPLTKIKVRGLLPIPDLPDPNLLLSWKQDKNPENGKESLYMKLKIQASDEDIPIYSTMRIFNDGTADLMIQPPKKTRLLDPVSDLQDAPEALDSSMSDMPFLGIVPKLAQASVVFKLRLKREDQRVTKSNVKLRLKMFSSIFQEVPPLPDEQPLVMLRYKGVSNFTNETRVFAFLTLIAEHDMVSGERDESKWATRVAEEFQISLEEARKQVVAWISQRGEFALAVSDTKDYILNKNPGVDIAVFEQHPTYTFHIYSDQDSKTYNTIVNMLGILITAPQSAFTAKTLPVIAAEAPVATAVANEEAENFAFDPDDEDIPDFVKATMASTAPLTTAPANEEAENFAFDPNDEDVPDFMKATMAATVAPTIQAPTTAKTQAPTAAEEKEDREAAKAFEKPTDVTTIQLAKYYIDRLKLADPSIFNYQRADPSERGYVSHCAANESRQPIVLDHDEYTEMHGIYGADKDLEFIEYPTHTGTSKPQKRQPTDKEDKEGQLDGRPYPSETNKEVVWIVKYGSKAKKMHYYFCPRFFCIRDRLMVRAKDFFATRNRHAPTADKEDPATWPAKSAESCPFCAGTVLSKEDIKDKKRSPTKTILQRKTRPGSESERSIYVGFLDRRTPAGLALPCCFATIDNKFNPDDPEFVRLGFREAAKVPAVTVPTLAQPADTTDLLNIVALEEGATALAQPIADAMQATVATLAVDEKVLKPNLIKYDYYRVIQGVSVKSIVDSNRIPLRIIEPKTADDPKAGPQIGFLPEALDKYFMQDSTSDKFAERIEIVSKLKPSAQGFLRLAVDNSSKEQSFLSAVAPFFYLPNAEAVLSTVFDPIETRIPPKKFMQINGGNLVHEFFKKCDKKHTNDMRLWAATHLGISELRSSNIPAIERLMNSYECFKQHIDDPTQKKDLRVFFDIFSEPSIMPPRGILFIVLEMTVEEISVKKGDKIEFKTEVKFDKVRCPPYPLNEGQMKADIGFLVHYTRITRDRYTHANTYTNIGWDPLFYVDGTSGIPESRHKPTLFFQRSQEATWPPIVQKRVHEFLNKCSAINRGPFTSEFGLSPFALISAQEIITALRMQPSGMVRDAYNHLVGVGYKLPGKAGSSAGIAAVPISDDGTVINERTVYLDWDDFDAPPINKLIEFYVKNINPMFPQYKGYIPRKQIRMRGTDLIIGLRLDNQFVIPASSAQESNPVSEAEYPIEDIDHLDWDINKTIAYDSETRIKAFQEASKGGDEIKDPKADTYLKLELEGSQDEIEDVYQHLRLTFSTWLATGAGSMKRDKLKDILKDDIMPLNEKRKRLDILLYSDIHGWLEPKESGEKSDIGFLRIDCQVQGQAACKGRCVWAPKTSDDENCGPCKIHTPKTDGTIVNVPRMLYLRLVDELIRYAAKREEIFSRQVSRLTIRREAQRFEDQYIVPEGSSDWTTWWEMLRSEWFTAGKEQNKFFDEQYSPIPSGLPKTDTRVLPDQLKVALGPTDPKVDELVWNPSTTPDRPFSFLRPILRFNPITSKPESTLDITELDAIVSTNVQVLYMPSGNMLGSMRRKRAGATEAIIITAVDGTVGWISQRGSYGVKIPLQALPDSLNMFRLV
jgi:hypothetical protein